MEIGGASLQFYIRRLVFARVSLCLVREILVLRFQRISREKGELLVGIIYSLHFGQKAIRSKVSSKIKEKGQLHDPFGVYRLHAIAFDRLVEELLLAVVDSHEAYVPEHIERPILLRAYLYRGACAIARSSRQVQDEQDEPRLCKHFSDILLNKKLII